MLPIARGPIARRAAIGHTFSCGRAALRMRCNDNKTSDCCLSLGGDGRGARDGRHDARCDGCKMHALLLCARTLHANASDPATSLICLSVCRLVYLSVGRLVGWSDVYRVSHMTHLPTYPLPFNGYFDSSLVHLSCIQVRQYRRIAYLRMFRYSNVYYPVSSYIRV